MMSIDKRCDGSVTHLYIRGELDWFTADELKDVGLRALRVDCDCLRLDLSGVTFISSRGLAALIAIRNDALPAHSLVLENVPSVVHRVLEVSGLNAVFTIE